MKFICSRIHFSILRDVNTISEYAFTNNFNILLGG